MSCAPELHDLGFTPRWQARFAEYAALGLVPGRVVRSARGHAIVATGAGVERAKLATVLRREAVDGTSLPVVGDWVAVLAGDDLDVPLVEAVLERTSAIVRGDPGQTSDVQVLAANVDVVFVVHPLAAEPNLRRIERELTLAWESGALPLVVLTKADLAADPGGALAAVQAVALGAEVLLTSACAGSGIQEVLATVAEGRTAVLIGPSGAGKSTLVNAMLGEERLATREVRVNDGRGRHTTVARELIQLTNGGLIIDTPGLRALALTGSESGIAAAFPDIEAAAEHCRFRDCAHTGEPGCAVTAAVAAGTLSAERLQSYVKLVAEARVAATKIDPRVRAEQRRAGRTLSKTIKRYHRDHGQT